MTLFKLKVLIACLCEAVQVAVQGGNLTPKSLILSHS